MPAATAPASAAARLERLPFSGYHKRIFFIIAIAFFFDSVDLGTMTFVLGSIRKEFGLSTAAAGLVASASFFGMVLGAAVAGLLADRFGRRPVFQWSMVLCPNRLIWRGFGVKYPKPSKIDPKLFGLPRLHFHPLAPPIVPI